MAKTHKAKLMEAARSLPKNEPPASLGDATVEQLVAAHAGGRELLLTTLKGGRLFTRRAN